jgi:hypothetical protein
LVLCTSFVTNNTLAGVQQQLQQCPDPAPPEAAQLQMLRFRQRREQQQQLVTLQLQAVLVLLRSSLVQQPAAQHRTLQVAGQLAMLLVSLSGWRQAANASMHSSGNSSSSSRGGRYWKAVAGMLLAVCLLSWFLLPVWFATSASILGGSYVIWHWNYPGNNTHDDVPLLALESQQQQPAPVVSGRRTDGSSPSVGFAVYDSRSDVAGMLAVALQPNCSSSSVGYVSWSATWQPTGAALSGATALQLQVLHTLPLHRFRCRRQQQRSIQPVTAGGGAPTNDELVKDQDKGVLEPEQLSAHSYEPAAAGTALNQEQIVDLHHHPVLSSQAKEQPLESVVVPLLDRLMQKQQPQNSEPQQQQERQQQQPHEQQQHGGAAGAGGVCTHGDRSASGAGYGHVLWVCLDPPMLLEGLPAGGTSAAWLLQQQQQLQEGNSSSNDSDWRPPFPAALWPQVLDWLQQVAAALAKMHGEGGVYGGVHAGVVYLVEKGTSDDNHKSSGGSDSAGISRQQKAVLSLVVPWQHAVTSGCVVDGALAPPEVLIGKQHPTTSAAADVYGFGMLLWQFATGWVPQQQLEIVSVEDNLQVYDELSWCAEMVQVYGTTFPGAAAAAATCGADAAATGVESGQTAAGVPESGAAEADTEQQCGWVCRHGGLPRAALAWLPPGYSQLLYDCCRSDPAARPSMAAVCQRVGELRTLV